MDINFLYKGFILGFSVSAPIGPIGVLCINRTINKSYISGLMTGLGAATVDLIYGLVAGLGLSIISNFIVNQKIWLQSIGLLFLIYLGLKTLLKKQTSIDFHGNIEKGLIKDFISTFVLMITNPATILFFLTVFASMGISGSTSNNFDSILLVIGVFLGSGSWWVILSLLTHKLKDKLNKTILAYINILSGILILIFSLFIIRDLINGFM